jgi:tetratricopeptide (TPR) repeat protein
MVNSETKKLFDKGIKTLTEGNILSALSCFEKALKIEENPLISSYLAFCIAKERGQVQKAISLCNDAIKEDPENSFHYLNLGKIYLLEKKNEEAVNIFRQGLHHYEQNHQILDELNKIVTRKPLIIPFLKRSNVINKYLGIIFSRLKLR